MLGVHGEHYAKLVLVLRGKDIPYDEIATILEYVFELKSEYVQCIIRSVQR